MITSVVAKEADGNVQITFTVPWKEIKKSQDETVLEMAKDVEIPGFRKGKAPIEKVREKINQSQLIEHSLSHILPKALSNAIDEHKLKLALYPKFELVSAKDNEDWQVRAVSCELPEVNLGDYKKIVAGELRAASLKKELKKEEKEQVVIKALIDNIKTVVPKILIEEEADSRLSALLARLEKLGLSLEGYLTSMNKKAEDLRSDYAQQAHDSILLDLALNSVVEDQDIKVTQAEVSDALRVADSKDNSPQRMRLVESILKRGKALDFLINLN